MNPQPSHEPSQGQAEGQPVEERRGEGEQTVSYPQPKGTAAVARATGLVNKERESRVRGSLRLWASVWPD